MAQIIRPEDFNKKTNDPNRHLWRHEDMAALVQALDGAEVIAETNRGLGHAWPVRLVRMTGNGVLCQGEGMNRAGIIYPLRDMGVIVDTRPNAKAKWDALEIIRQRHMAEDRA